LCYNTGTRTTATNAYTTDSIRFTRDMGRCGIMLEDVTRDTLLQHQLL